MEHVMFDRALEGFASRIEKVGDYAAPTPCADWDVRALANHVVYELLWVPPLLDGLTIAEVGDRFEGDVLGDDPAGAYDAARRGALLAAGAPGARERTVHLSFGDFPGADYLGQVGSDVAIHTWDLARATSQDEDLGDDLVAAVHDFLAPQAEVWRAGGAFGPAVDTGPDATPQQRLLGITGRQA